MFIRMIQNKAFTLVELIVVIALVAILAATGIPTYRNISVRAEETRIKRILTNARSAIDMWRSDQLLANPDGASEGWPTLADVQSSIFREVTFPENPWASTSPSTVVAVAGADHSVPGGGGWCYDAASGTFWANTTGDADGTYTAVNTW